MFLRRRTIVTNTDEELVQLLREGHRSALGDLWDRYAHLLFGVGMKYLKDTDRSKDEVVELFAGLRDLLVKHEVKNFRPWVHTVMRNRCLQALRRKTYDGPLPEELLHSADPVEQEDAALHESTLQQLEQAITRLEPDQQLCIRLFHLDRCSYRQVADRTGHSIEQVRSFLQNGRRNLRILLQRATNTQHHADQNA